MTPPSPLTTPGVGITLAVAADRRTGRGPARDRPQRRLHPAANRTLASVRIGRSRRIPATAIADYVAELLAENDCQH